MSILRSGDEMNCGYECHTIGGPWISENPACPIHGDKSKLNSDREDSIRKILYRVWLRDLSSDDGYDLISDIIGY